MANRIRGITVEIGGDTTKLDKALKGTNKQLSSTQSSLRDVERLLKLDPGNVTLLEQRQRLLASAVETTSQKLRTLQQAAEGADAALARGQAYEEKYAPLKASLEDVGGKLEKLKAKQDQMDEAFATGQLSEEKYQEFNQTLEATQAEYDQLIQAQKELQKEFEGTKLNQEQYDALQRELVETQLNLEDLEEQAERSSVTLGRIGAAAEDVSGRAGKVADATKPLTTRILALGTAALATMPATEELRTDLSKLDNNARTAGVGVDAAREAFKAFTVATDETDSSVEAVSNLLQAGFTESNLQKAVEGLTGAYLAFPDTMKVESLADSLQETLATGEATGQFGELLDRLGVGAENFSAGLSQITDEASRQQYVLETLASSHGFRQVAACLILRHDLRGVFHFGNCQRVRLDLVNDGPGLILQLLHGRGEQHLDTGVTEMQPVNAMSGGVLVVELRQLHFLLSPDFPLYCVDLAFQVCVSMLVRISDAGLVQGVKPLVRFQDGLFDCFALAFQLPELAVQFCPELLHGLHGVLGTDHAHGLAGALLHLLLH